MKVSLHPVADANDPIELAYLARRNVVVSNQLARLSRRLPEVVSAILDESLAVWEKLPTSARFEVLSSPAFHRWWYWLSEAYRKGVVSELARLAPEFGRFVALPGIRSGVLSHTGIALPVNRAGEVHFPGHPTILSLPCQADASGRPRSVRLLAHDGTVRLAAEGLDIRLSVQELVDGAPPKSKWLRMTPVVPQTTLLVGATDSWTGDFLDELSRDAERPDHLRPTTVSQADLDCLAEALAVMGACWPEMRAEFLRHVRLLVPFQSDWRQSFTNTSFQGAVFVRNDFNDPVLLLDRLVHEASHLRLNVIMAVELLHHHGFDDKVSSPFRAGLRPFTGLYHGAFVFTRVCMALDRAAEVTGDMRYAERIAGMLSSVEEALLTLKEGNLTATGTDLLLEIALRIADLKQKYLPQAPPAALRLRDMHNPALHSELLNDAAARLDPPSGGSDPVFAFYLARLEAALPRVLLRLEQRVHADLFRGLRTGLEIFQSLPAESRRRIVGNPLFNYWWVTLMRRFLDRRRSSVENWLLDFHRFLVGPALEARLGSRQRLKMRVRQHSIRFPGYAVHLESPYWEQPHVLPATLEMEALAIHGPAPVSVTAAQLQGVEFHPLLVTRPTIGSSRIELDAGDPWIVGLLDSLNRRPAPEGYPARDYSPIHPPPPEIQEGLSLATQLIDKAWPEAMAEIRSYTRLIIPFQSDYYSTFTDMAFPGAVFLSETHRPFSAVLDTAEHILHEHSHLRFALMLEVDPILADDGRLYHSPWRRNPRDLNGMLQAVFVFARIARFLARAAKVTDAARALDRRQEVIQMVRRALQEMAVNENLRYTEAGRRLLAEVRSEVMA